MFSVRVSIYKTIPYFQSHFPLVVATAHTKSCPTKKKARPCPPAGGKSKKPKKPTKPTKPTKSTKPTILAKGPVCPGSGGSGSILKRAPKSGKVRLGFLPEEWFLFFHSKTGVTGPYIFGIVLINYLISKEKFVMEHEYYIGLSIFVIIYYAATNLGPALGAELDKEVDAIAASFEKTRTDEKNYYESIIKNAKDAQWRAEGQKLLMDAKKENITMQLEAAYRERLMHVYKMVKDRMDYQVRLYQAQARIQQKWMLGWILSNVRKSITPELEKQALDRAIQDLTAAAARAK